MVNQEKLDILKERLKGALDLIEEFEKEQSKQDQNQIEQKIISLEESINQLKKAVIG